jgi:hypothetical protein
MGAEAWLQLSTEAFIIQNAGSPGVVHMPDPSHEVRNSAIDATRVYNLDGEGLNWRDGDRQELRRYADIATVHLISYPSYGGLHLQCTLTDRAGKKVKIGSHHYVSNGRFEDRGKSYGAFIRELVARLGSQGHDVGFHYGSRIMWVVWMVLFWSSVVILIGFIFAVIGGTRLSWSSIAPISVVAVFLPVSWSMIGRNRAETFDPKSPPAGFLGEL